MVQIWETENRKLTLALSIKCQGTCRFRVVAEDMHPNSRYVDREFEVEGYRTIDLKFPVSPKKTRIIVEVAKSNANGNKVDFIVGIEEKPLTTYNIEIDNEVQGFLDVSIPFSQQCGYSIARNSGRIFTNKERKFRINFFPVIRDFGSGTILNTPARIGHRTGIIEVSKASFDRYTFAMRMIILLHEFSHKYRNPKINLEISNEVGADINALYIYLGLGFSKVDAIFVFANVFLKAQTEGNIIRMRKIMNYIDKFESGQFAQKN